MINISINQNSKNRVQAYIDEYANNLRDMCLKFIDNLLDSGYEIATANTTGTFAGYITISKQVEENEDGIKGILYATDSGNITNYFKHSGEIVSVDISPLLMCEFGSGLVAKNPLNIAGVGQGTLNTYGHAFDKNGWWFVTEDNRVIHSVGYTPHAPMYKALIKMQEEVMNIAKEVF